MEELMDAIVERCAGLDVHQATVVACLNAGPPGTKPVKEVRTFGTTLPELEELRDWLKVNGCTLVAMESTGIYWRPVHAVLEGHFELVVGNAHHIKNVPGRKTDVKDCDWISDLARHGLIAQSFVPPRPIRDLRDLTRYRRKLVQAGAAERNRLIKLLESANIKLSGVIATCSGCRAGRCCRRWWRASTAEMAQLARKRMRRKLPELERALNGRLEEHHRFLLGVQMRRIEAAEADLDELDRRLREKLARYSKQMRLLRQIPGVDWVIAATIIAEIGVDMSVFANAAHLASWTAICPGNHESAGKQRGGRTRKGNVPSQDRAGHGRQRRRQDTRHLSGRKVPPLEGAPRRASCGRRHRSQDPGGRIPHAHQRQWLRGHGRQLSRPAQHAPYHKQLDP
jgi:transposase